MFYISRLEQNIIKKEQVDKNVTGLDTGNSKEYELKTIWDSAVYVEELESDQLPNFYYLVAWKDYPKGKNT